MKNGIGTFEEENVNNQTPPIFLEFYHEDRKISRKGKKDEKNLEGLFQIFP